MTNSKIKIISLVVTAMLLVLLSVCSAAPIGTPLTASAAEIEQVAENQEQEVPQQTETTDKDKQSLKMPKTFGEYILLVMRGSLLILGKYWYITIIFPIVLILVFIVNIVKAKNNARK